MRVTGDYQSPDRTRLSISLTFRGNDFVADYITIANETYIQVPGTDISQVSDSWDGLDLRETLRFDPDSMENLVLIGEEDLDGEKVYHLKGSLASDAEGLLNSVPGSLVMVIPIGGVLVGAEFWIGVEDFLVRRTIQNIDIELSSDMGKRGEWSLSGAYVLSADLARVNIGRRRRAESDGQWRKRYGLRAGIEGTNSELKRRHGLGRLRVRGGERVRLAVYLKALACNVKRMARARLDEMLARPAVLATSPTAA